MLMGNETDNPGSKRGKLHQTCASSFKAAGVPSAAFILDPDVRGSRLFQSWDQRSEPTQQITLYSKYSLVKNK